MPDDTKIIKIGNVSTQCGIIPYKLNNSGCIWGNFYGGDGSFYMQIIKKASNIVYFDKNIYIMKDYLRDIYLINNLYSNVVESSEYINLYQLSKYSYFH
jgi:hypothetical protein